MNADGTGPVEVHCRTCLREWVACELPLPIEQFVEALVANVECPNCGWHTAMLGPAEQSRRPGHG